MFRLIKILMVTVAIAFLLLSENSFASKRYDEKRAELIKEIEEYVFLTQEELGRSKLSPKVLRALSRTPRHEFVPKSAKGIAYKNRPIKIGYGQTISQPYIVAIMTELLDLKSSDRVFELGTGSGYQAAILSHVVSQVYSMEIIQELGERAKKTLQHLDYHNVETRVGDGYYGWEEMAPFDAIIVTAAGDHVPPPLIKQLKPGGRMIIPVGGRFLVQQLVLITKRKDGTLVTREVMPVRFVPITGTH